MDAIKHVLSKVYTGTIDADSAASLLIHHCSKYELAEFIVDIYNRGWITNFNLGIDEDGKII